MTDGTSWDHRHPGSGTLPGPSLKIGCPKRGWFQPCSIRPGRNGRWKRTNHPGVDREFLVGGLEHEFYDFPYIGNFIIPTDALIFFRGVGLSHQPGEFDYGHFTQKQTGKTWDSRYNGHFQTTTHEIWEPYGKLLYAISSRKATMICKAKTLCFSGQKQRDMDRQLGHNCIENHTIHQV
jgi:hypothetical protein